MKLRRGEAKMLQLIRRLNPCNAISSDELRTGDLGQKAFEAGKRWRTSGEYYSSGCSNARVVKCGFLKFWNNLSAHQGTGMKKRLEKNFREGWKVGLWVERNK